MNWSSALSWLATLKGRREGDFDEADRAGMGTAFGLDASMAAAEESARDAPAGPQSQTGESWERRLVRRSDL